MEDFAKEYDKEKLARIYQPGRVPTREEYVAMRRSGREQLKAVVRSVWAEIETVEITLPEGELLQV